MRELVCAPKAIAEKTAFGWTAIRSAFAALLLTCNVSQALTLTGAKLVKVQGVQGAFETAIDLTKSIDGLVTVESRAIGTGHQILFQFDGPISTPGIILVTNVNGWPIGAATALASGSTIAVTLTGVSDNQRVAVALNNVNGSFSFGPISIGLLVGDINNTSSVNSSDISSVKARSGQTTNASNFKFDLNSSGAINSSDISAVKARSGLVASAINVAPIANAGRLQSVVEGSVVTLDGSASSDANADPLTYLWTLATKPIGSTATLSSSIVSKPTFTADLAGTYSATLVVNDGLLNSSPTSVSVAVEIYTSVPTVPVGLQVTNATSNSVALVWNASSGGAGGVYSYQVYRNGQQIGSTNASKTSFEDVNLNPMTAYEYAVSATSVGGTKSANSTTASGSTLSFSLMKAKLTPYIIFETATGRVRVQAFASQGAITAAALSSGYDVIEHARIDTTLYGIRTVGVRQYSIYLYSSGASVEPPLAGILVGGPPNGNASVIKINMVTGLWAGSVSGQTITLLINIGDGLGGYISGEIL